MEDFKQFLKRDGLLKKSDHERLWMAAAYVVAIGLLLGVIVIATR